MNIDQEPEADLEFCYYSGSESEVDDSPTVMSNTSTIQDEQHEIAQHSVESSIENATEVGETLHNFTEDNAHIEADVIMISSDEEDDDRATMTRKSIEPKQDDASIMTTLQTDRQSVLYKFQPAPLIFVSTDEEEEEEEEITVKSEPVEDIPKKNVEISDGSIRNILLRDGHQKRALLHMRRIKKKIKKLAKKKATQKTIKPIEEKQCQIIENEPQQIAETEPDTQQPDDQSQEHIENEKAKVKPIVSTPIRKSQRQISKQNRIAQMSEDQKANVSENQKAKVPEKSKPDLVTPIPNADESSEFNEETPSNDITKLSLTFKPIG
ncbi:uncharacterized protein LOC116347349, partial [Contarinia nasturtii]|uniref:uncharacterized protein LOC116347349 n=1 Tax=Contarinia nasturtii TaxID=265458 RepID=UPI0012D42B84